MTPTDAAARLVELYGNYRKYCANSTNPEYEKAIAMACAALQRSTPEVIIPLSNFVRGGIKE
jgi:hypothetical protein